MSLNLEPLSVEDNSNVSANERQIMEEVARPRDELVALASDLIAFDTTTRERNDDPARDERALQEYFAARLRAAGAETDLWEPVPEDVAGSPKTPSGMRFDGRPQLAARFSRAGGGRSLLLQRCGWPSAASSHPCRLHSRRAATIRQTFFSPAVL